MKERNVAVYENSLKGKIKFFGKFHQWGMDSVQVSECAVANFTVAIVEKDNGEVVNVRPDEIKFVDEEEKKNLQKMMDEYNSGSPRRCKELARKSAFYSAFDSFEESMGRIFVNNYKIPFAPHCCISADCDLANVEMTMYVGGYPKTIPLSEEQKLYCVGAIILAKERRDSSKKMQEKKAGGANE